MTKRLLRDHGIATPEFVLVEKPSDIAFVQMAMPLFAKPVAEGTSKGIGADAKITSRAQLTEVCERLLREHDQPVLVERYLPGRELTVGILGTGKHARAVAALEVRTVDATEPGIYTYLNKEEWQTRGIEYVVVRDALADAACAVSLEAWRALGCRDGGRVDLRQNDAGELEVMEVNPLPGMHPTHSDLPIMCGQIGMAYDELIGAIVESASERLDDGRIARRELLCAS